MKIYSFDDKTQPDLLSFLADAEAGKREIATIDEPWTRIVIFKGRPEDVDSGYTVWWTDYVANEWAVGCEEISVALIFLGVVVECSRRDDGAFVRDIENFETAVMHFYARELVS